MLKKRPHAGAFHAYGTLLHVVRTLDAVDEVLLVGSDVQVLNDGVHRRDGRGFHHRCLFQAAYAGLWWGEECNMRTKNILPRTYKLIPVILPPI